MKIQVLSNPRTGSSYLYDILTMQHDTFECMHEPFAASHNEYKTILEQINASKNIIVKNHMYHLGQLETHNLLEQFKPIKFDHTIVLIRKDLFETALSLSLAMTVNQWNKDELNFESIKIDVSTFDSAINATWLELLRIIRNEYDIEYNEIVYYENLIFDEKSKYKKFRDKTMTVQNYKELHSFTIDFLNEKVPKLRDPDNISFDGTLVKINHIETT